MFLLVDKPKGLTSHDVVDRIRKITGEKRVGHGGTLDPNATGLLVVGVGRQATKKLGKIAKTTKKTYIAEVFLGEEKNTDDVEGIKIEKSKNKDQNFISRSKVLQVVKSFIGEQEQIPPVFSAIKIKGKKAYELAREGRKPKLAPRKITIYSIKLLNYQYPILKIRAEVSSGTYIRSLARDIGKKLGCGAYLRNLRRTKVGKFDIKEVVSLNELTGSNWKEHAILL